MKKIIVIGIIFIMALTFSACGNGINGQNNVTKQKPLVVLVTNVGDMGDEGFNDAGWSGVEKAKEENDIDIRCLETKNEKQLAENIQAACNDEAKLVVIMGSDRKEIIESTAKNNPDTSFLVVDGAAQGDNIANIEFKEEQGAFLAGMAAASQTKTKTVGFVGGEKIGPVEAYEYGFKAGVKNVSKDINVVTTYTNTFNDEEKGKEAAITLNKSGADVIMHAAGKSGIGVIEIANDRDIWAIGSDLDQSVLNSKHVLCSSTKDISNAVRDEIKKSLKGNFKSETITKTIENNGVGISDNAGNLPSIITSKLDDWRKAIGKGDIVVPYNQKTLDAFTAAELK